jgi:hypothetical protein
MTAFLAEAEAMERASKAGRAGSKRVIGISFGGWGRFARRNQARRIFDTKLTKATKRTKGGKT